MGRVAWNRVLWTLTIVGVGAVSLWTWSDSSQARERGTFAALEHGFRSPPLDTAPRTWWHWVDDRIVFVAPHEPHRQSLPARLPAPLWTDGLARADYLLRQGQFVGDVLYFDDEATPVAEELGRSIHADLPDGHGFDVVNTDRLLAELSSRNRRLMTRDSRSYRLLYLGPDQAQMSMVVLGRLRNLIRLGANVVGNPPKISPAHSPDADAFAELVSSIWTDEARSPSGAAWGHGRVFSGRTVADVLETLGVASDVAYPSQNGTRLLSSHRTMPGAEVYFIANAGDRHETLDLSFRVSGRRAELWDPASGAMTAAGGARSENGRTTVPLSLSPYGLMFVVFRE